MFKYSATLQFIYTMFVYVVGEAWDLIWVAFSMKKAGETLFDIITAFY